MYEIVARFRHREEVIERVDSLATALVRAQVYRRQGLMAYCRPTVRGAAGGHPGRSTAATSRVEPPCTR